MKLSEIIGHNLKLARADAGLGQKELAGKLRLSSHSAISEMESGRRRISAIELARLADVLGKPVDWFFDPDASREDFVSRARAARCSEAVKKGLRAAEKFYANFLLLQSLLKSR